MESHQLTLQNDALSAVQCDMDDLHTSREERIAAVIAEDAINAGPAQSKKRGQHHGPALLTSDEDDLDLHEVGAPFAISLSRFLIFIVLEPLESFSILLSALVDRLRCERYTSRFIRAR